MHSDWYDPNHLLSNAQVTGKKIQPRLKHTRFPSKLGRKIKSNIFYTVKERICCCGMNIETFVLAKGNFLHTNKMLSRRSTTYDPEIFLL